MNRIVPSADRPQNSLHLCRPKICLNPKGNERELPTRTAPVVKDTKTGPIQPKIPLRGWTNVPKIQIHEQNDNGQAHNKGQDCKADPAKSWYKDVKSKSFPILGIIFYCFLCMCPTFGIKHISRLCWSCATDDAKFRSSTASTTRAMSRNPILRSIKYP